MIRLVNDLGAAAIRGVDELGRIGVFGAHSASRPACFRPCRRDVYKSLKLYAASE